MLTVILILNMSFTGCSNEKSSYFYHSTYIEANGGKRWLNYALLNENTYNGLNDGTISVLKQNDHNQEYHLFFTIDSSYYKKGDIILGTSKYIYFFNQDTSNPYRIVSYNLNSDSPTPTIIDNNIFQSIVTVYGANKDYIYISYNRNGKNIYLKMSNDLAKSYELENIEKINEEIEYNILEN